jgi:hypothetical protein
VNAFRQARHHRQRHCGDRDAAIRADARVLATTLKAGERGIEPARRVISLVRPPAELGVNGVRVNARDGAAIRNEAKLTITALRIRTELVDAA